MLWLSSKATYPRGLNSLEGSCPCLGPWTRVYGAHLATQAREDQTVLHGSYGAANIFLLGRYRSARGASLLERECGMTDKVEMRATMRATRKGLSDATPNAGARAATFLDDLPPALLVAVYRAVGAEFDPEPLAHALVQAGHQLCLPVALERDAALIFRRWMPGDPLEVDVAGCPAPLPLAEVVTPDLIVTPLLAFDATGGRLGQGGGFYDRTFAALPDAIRVGLAYEGQRVDALPMQDHDIRLHGVLTEVGYTPARKV